MKVYMLRDECRMSGSGAGETWGMNDAYQCM